MNHDKSNLPHFLMSVTENFTCLLKLKSSPEEESARVQPGHTDVIVL